MTTYTWQFPALDVYPTYQGLTNAVESVHWRLTGDDGAGHTATAYGEQPVGAPDPDNFTPFASLTAAQVQGWVEAQMGAEVTHLHTDLDGQIAQQVSPSVVSMEPPWSTN